MTEDWTRGDWMQLYSGARFYPMDPQPGEVSYIDIAHALGLLCRYGGHVDRFYSVAEHCVLMSEAVAPEHALAALLHDATEAYVVDVPRPLKRYLPDYKEIEQRVWFAIARRFSLELELPAEVKLADTRILLTERDTLMKNTRYSWAQEDMEPLPVKVTGWGPRHAERNYTHRLLELTGMLGVQRV